MPETTRRGFVKGSAASLVAMGFASSVSADKSPPSPNDKIQVGMVGAAGRAGSLLRMFAAREDVEIVGIADIDQGRLASGVAHVEKVKGRRPAGHGDFRRLTDNQQIDVIVVGTPDHWHAIPTIMACQAGKDVYVEKPDGHNMVEGQRMVQAMRKHKRIVQLGTQARSTPAHRESMQYVRSGRLGRVLVAKAWESAKQGPIGHPSDSQPPPGVDYDMWLGPAPQRPFNVRRFHGSWRWFFDYGTGDLGNDGVHRIDVARWALATAVEAETFLRSFEVSAHNVDKLVNFHGEVSVERVEIINCDQARRFIPLVLLCFFLSCLLFSFLGFLFFLALSLRSFAFITIGRRRTQTRLNISLVVIRSVFFVSRSRRA